MSIWFIYIGIILIGFGLVAFLRQRRKIANYIRTEGIISDLIPVSSAGTEGLGAQEGKQLTFEKKVRFRLEVRFKTRTGQAVTFVSNLSVLPAGYKIGDSVIVLYNPKHPGEAQINNPLYLWFAPLMLIFFGLLFIGMGYLGFLNG